MIGGNVQGKCARVRKTTQCLCPYLARFILNCFLNDYGLDSQGEYFLYANLENSPNLEFFDIEKMDVYQRLNTDLNYPKNGFKTHFSDNILQTRPSL